MADKKISQLTAATTPLDGTEVLPVVQNSATKKVSVANLTAGRDVAVLGLTADTDTLFVDSTNHFVGVKTLAPKHPLQVYGAIKAGGSAGQQYGMVVLGDDASNATYNGIYRGGSGSVGGGNQVNIGSYEAINFAVGATAFGSQTVVGKFGYSDFTFTVGNLVQGTAAKGVNFTANTPAAGMTSQLLNWYEEGTWTPNQGAGLTLVGAFSSAGTYTRIGRQVFIRGSVSGATSVAVASAGAITTNLPYSAAADATGTAINAANNASSILRVSSATLTTAIAVAATTTITFSAVYSV